MLIATSTQWPIGVLIPRPRTRCDEATTAAGQLSSLAVRSALLILDPDLGARMGWSGTREGARVSLGVRPAVAEVELWIGVDGAGNSVASPDFEANAERG